MATAAWWMHTAEAAGAVFTDANVGDAIIRADATTGRVLFGAGSNVGAALQVGSGYASAPVLRAARFHDTTAGFSDLGASLSNARAAVEAVAAGAGLCNAAVSARHIASNAVLGGHIGPAAVLAGHVASNAVLSGHIGPAAVLAGHVASNAVLSGHIAAAAVLPVHIASNAVLAGHIAAGSIDAATKLTGAVPVASGGTGATSLAAGRLLVGGGAAAVSAATALVYDAGTSNLGAVNVAASGRLHAAVDLVVGAPGGVRYQLYVDAADSNLKVNRIDAAGNSALYLDLSVVKALLSAMQLTP